MAIEIKMPQLSDTMSSGKILQWKKREGDQVTRGDILAEVETDKANLEIESFQAGVLLKIVVPEGEVGKVGEVIAVIGIAGEAVNALPAAAGPKSEAIEAPKMAAQSSLGGAAIGGASVAPVSASSTPVPSASATQHLTVVDGSSRIKASPLAKKVAEQMNVNLAGVAGTGPNGRIIRKDVEAAAGTEQSVTHQSRTTASASQSFPAAGSGQGILRPFSKMRETIATRMQQSVVEAPHFYVTSSIVMDEALRLREILKEEADYKGISVNHLVIKAVAYGLRREPRVNFAVKSGQIYEPGGINIGIITAVDDGLLIPVVKEADKLSLKDVVFEARAAVDRARAGRPTSSDLTGGTFSISNMGMFDVENFTAIINPGQGAILAVSSVKEQPIVRNGQIVSGKVMKVTLSVDHRIIDGVMGSTFLMHFKKALETPALLMA